MYFWSIDKLKADLIEEPMSSGQILPYILLTFSISAAYYWLFPSESVAQISLHVLSGILGVYWLIQKNGGNNSHYFLDRFITIAWLGYLRMLILTAVITSLVFIATNDNLWFKLPHDFLDYFALIMYIINLIFFYWFMSKHIADVAQKAKY
jgi:hypothetical protein